MNCWVISLSRSSRFCSSFFSNWFERRLYSISAILLRMYFCSSRSFFCGSCSRSNSLPSPPSNTMLRTPFMCSFASRCTLAASSRFSSMVMGRDSLASRAAEAGFFFFFWVLAGRGGGLRAGLSAGRGSPETLQQQRSNSLVSFTKSSLSLLKRQLLWKILMTSAWNCPTEEYLPLFSLASIVLRSIGSRTIYLYSGIFMPSTSTGSRKGSAHLCCCSRARVPKHGFTASEMVSTLVGFLGGGGGASLGRGGSMGVMSSSSSAVFFLAAL